MKTKTMKTKHIEIRRGKHPMFGTVYEIWVNGKYVGIEKTRTEAQAREIAKQITESRPINL